MKRMDQDVVTAGDLERLTGVQYRVVQTAYSCDPEQPAPAKDGNASGMSNGQARLPGQVDRGSVPVFSLDGRSGSPCRQERDRFPSFHAPITSSKWDSLKRL